MEHDETCRSGGGSVWRRRRLRIHDLDVLGLRPDVGIAIGSDWYGQTARREFDALRALRLWDNVSLMRMWFEFTPRSIFPQRVIGRLDAGYEASFLVLDRDPTADINSLTEIRLRVKQGCIM